MHFRDKVVMALASGGYVGYIPLASGTFGSLIGLLLCLGLSHVPFLITLIILIIFIFISIWISDQAEKQAGKKDPGLVVIDEIAGMAVTLLGIPFTLQNAIWGFLIFRFFDIVKPFPIRRIDKRLPGGYGIVLDDVLAGVYGNIAMRMIISYSYFNGLFN
jgi:phosphatidylglycerophosphatase A